MVQRDYVEADAAAWKHYDPYLEDWISNEPRLKDEEKGALLLLNEGRKARIHKALEATSDAE